MENEPFPLFMVAERSWKTRDVPAYLRLWVEPLKPPNQLFRNNFGSRSPRGPKIKWPRPWHELQTLITALQDLVESQRHSSFSKHIKSPEVFKPETRSEELQTWEDWKFSMEIFIGVVDGEMLRDMKEASASPRMLRMSEWDLDRQNRSEKLFSLLSTLLRNRPLQLLRGVADNNGYEAWRVLCRDMQPPTRQRSLALVQSLNRLKFEAGRTITEQLPQFELLIREYEQTSRTTYPDDLKVAAIIAALPGQLQVQVQMSVSESTTYEEIKQKIGLFEQVTTQWSTEPGLRMLVKQDLVDDKGPMAMEVDMVQKGFKGKSKDGKFGGKGRPWVEYNGKGKAARASHGQHLRLGSRRARTG